MCVGGGGLSEHLLRHSLGKGEKGPQGILLELGRLVRGRCVKAKGNAIVTCDEALGSGKRDGGATAGRAGVAGINKGLPGSDCLHL